MKSRSVRLTTFLNPLFLLLLSTGIVSRIVLAGGADTPLVPPISTSNSNLLDWSGGVYHSTVSLISSLQPIAVGDGVYLNFIYDSNDKATFNIKVRKGEKLRDVLMELTFRDPNYSWKDFGPVVVVAPSKILNDPGSFLNRGIKYLEINDEPPGQIVVMLDKYLQNKNYQYDNKESDKNDQQWGPNAGDYQAVTDLENITLSNFPSVLSALSFVIKEKTVLDVLNDISIKDNTAWMISSKDRTALVLFNNDVPANVGVQR